MATITLQPGSEGQDVWIANWWHYDSNYGVDDEWLAVTASRTINYSLRQEYSLLQFDLNGLAVSDLTIATLRIYHVESVQGNTFSSLYVDQVQAAWNENYGFYDYTLPYAPITTVTGTPYGWIDIDVTQAVAAWLADPASNYGLMLRPLGESSVYGDWNRFVSSDATGDLAQYHPQLVITYASTNHVPVAANIAATTNEDTGNPVMVQASFIDLDGTDTFTFKTDTTETIGKVTNSNDGAFTYDPNGKFEALGVGETATDTFTYTVTDNQGAGSTATATVTIHGENDVPLAVSDAMVVRKATIVTVDAPHGVISNDTDPDSHDVLHVSAVNGQSGNVGHTISGTYGTLILNADGSYSYSANKSIPSLPSKGGVQDQFTYTVDDGHGGIATSTLTVTVQTQQALGLQPSFSIRAVDANKGEGDIGATPFTFLITRDGNATGTNTVQWAVAGGSGVTSDGQDFIGGAFPNGAVVFGPGDLSKTVTINVHGDSAYESSGKSEKFVVALSNASSGTTINSKNGSALGLIENDDDQFSPVVEIYVTFADGKRIQGSGVVIGSNDILTASHLFQDGADHSNKVVQITVLTRDSILRGDFLFDTDNVSMDLGDSLSTNLGSGAPALIKGYDPNVQGAAVNTHFDLAVVGLPVDLGNYLGSLPIRADAKAGIYTLVGYKAEILIESTDTAKISKFFSDREWTGHFESLTGMSGGPLLSKDGYVVGIQSSESSVPTLGTSLNRIDSIDLQNISQWMHLNDFLLA